jgi:hypothetical protein
MNTRISVHRLAFGIYGIDFSVIMEIILLHVTDGGAQIEGSIGGANDNNRLRIEEEFHRVPA